MAGKQKQGCPFTGAGRNSEQKPRTLIQWTESSNYIDTLYKKSRNSTHCSDTSCTGSLMNTVANNAKLEREKAVKQAEEFLTSYYEDPGNHEPPEKSKEERIAEVIAQMKANGKYRQTSDELVWGAKTAWRNAARCSGRIVWKTLRVFDCRHVTTAQEMFDNIIVHFDYSFNGGNIRPAITVFREREEGKVDLRVWNYQVLSYAGYRQEDGSVIGDPINVEFTEFCQKLGWKGNEEMFDFLPLVLSGDDGRPVLFELPERLHHSVKINHPTIPAISNMDLEWIAIPGVSNMMLEAGGIQYTASPFTGWFLSTEVATRDLLDVQRYNLMESLGQALNLDMSSNATMWKDQVALELNKAVLDSYTKAGVTMVDQFTNAEQFMTHFAQEHKERGGCPADWVWVVPPQSGSLVPTFHQEMNRYHLHPSYEYQDKIFLDYGRKKIKLSMKGAAWVVRLCGNAWRRILATRKKVNVFYATETGTPRSLPSKQP